MSTPNRTAAPHHYGDARIQPFNDANFRKLHIQFLLIFASSTIKAMGSADYDHGPHHFAYQATLTVKTDHDAMNAPSSRRFQYRFSSNRAGAAQRWCTGLEFQ